jgi:calcineurin-like phosphoesterase family protein
MHTRRVQREVTADVQNLNGEIEIVNILEDDPRYINVSCEQTNLTPVPLDWIFNKCAERN